MVVVLDVLEDVQVLVQEDVDLDALVVVVHLVRILVEEIVLEDVLVDVRDVLIHVLDLVGVTVVADV